MRITLAGGNGFIGRALTEHLLERGHEVAWLSHRPGRVRPPDGVTEVLFDPSDATGPWRAQVVGSEAVVNLSGYPIASRWNEQVKEELVDSRLDTTRALVSAACAAREAGTGPATFVGASGIGIYSDQGDAVLSEEAAVGGDWLADLAVAWERAAYGAELCGCRVVTVRTGLTLGDEGLVPRLKLPVSLFAGGPIGTGDQWVPWVHHADIVGIYTFAIENPALSGPVNACAPAPVTMREFMRAFGRAMHRPSWLPVPMFALRLVLGEVAPYTVMSQRASSEKLLAAGYEYAFGSIDAAFGDVLRRPRRPAR